MYIPDNTPPLIPSAMAKIDRRLPQPGEVMVRKGERVEPEDIIARAYVSLPPQIVNVAQALGISPARVERAMRREIGNKVTEGEALARSSRVLGRTCHVPVSGIITAVDTETGYVTIAPDPVEFELFSAVRGVVMDIQPYEGVTIETMAAQVYGVFGIGEERGGVLRLLVTDPTEVVTDDQIDARSSYAILICGSGITAAALRRAVQHQVRGVIVGSIEEHELRVFLEWADREFWQLGPDNWSFPALQHVPDPGMTIMVTEGFGTRPMSSRIFDLLSGHDRQEVLIEGMTQLRYPLRRPRVVIPLSRTSGNQIVPSRPELRPEATVRLLNTEHLGAIATVQAVSSAPRRLASGVRTPAVKVILDDESPLWLPRTAVEVLD